MGNKTGKGGFKKGQSGNPKGRPPVLLPEVQREIDRNRNALKQLVLQYFALSEEQITQRQQTPGIPFLEKLLGQCFERTANDGNVDAFRKLLEIVFGKLPEEKEPFEVSEEEKIMVMTYRQRLAESNGKQALEDCPKDD
jgi:hypothetical protein